MKTTLDLIIELSLTGSITILIILLVRALAIKFPKKFSYLLWSVALFRLLVPFSVMSRWSLLGGLGWSTKRMAESSFGAGIISTTNQTVLSPIVNGVVKPLSSTLTVTNLAQNNLTLNYEGVLLTIWLIGVVVLLGFNLSKGYRLYNGVKQAVYLGDDVYQSSHFSSPFVIGILNPKIILPATLSDEERYYILAHEKVHVRRFDPLWRSLACITLTLHWFNPLVWLGFNLAMRDMEMSCDESVIQQYGHTIKKAYSSSMLRFAVGQPVYPFSPVAFGEGDTKQRVKNVLRFKKTKSWVGIVATLALIVLAVTLITNPIIKGDFTGKTYRVVSKVYEDPIYSFTYFDSTYPTFTITDQNVISRKEKSEINWVDSDPLEKVSLTAADFQDPFNLLASNDAKKFIDNADEIYVSRLSDEAGTTYWLFKQKNGVLYLAVGYDTAERHNSIRWFFELEEESFYISLETVYANRTNYVGNANKVVGVISGFAYPNWSSYDHFEMKTSEMPYGITVVLKSELAADDDLINDSTNYEILKRNALMTFALVENVKVVSFEFIDANDQLMSVSFDKGTLSADLNKEILKTLWEQGETYDQFKTFIASISVWE